MQPNRIIIIDDEVDIRYLLKNALSKRLYEVHGFENLKEGLTAISDIDPFLIFLDINLPDGNGLQSIAYIKKQLPLSKVIMISAFDGPDEKAIAFENGADGFIGKPFNRDKIYETLSGLAPTGS